MHAILHPLLNADSTIVLVSNYPSIRNIMAPCCSIGRGAQNLNSLYFKPMLRKGYHRKAETSMKLNGEAELGHKHKTSSVAATATSSNDVRSSWIPDDRTGIYYPKGQEKVMEDVSPPPANDFPTINCFSNPSSP